MALTLESPLELHPQVALRPEPFGALAYHYGNRRLIFLKHPDVVAVVVTSASTRRSKPPFGLPGSPSAVAAFVKALASLESSEVIRER